MGISDLLVPTDRLIYPRDIHPFAGSPEAYCAQQRAALVRKRAAFPHAGYPEPWVSVGIAPVKISDGHWQLVCACGNYPAYDPTWALACCFRCGAIYRQAPPVEWREIEAVLLKRPRPTSRHWLPGETLEDLRRENLAHGDEV
jgi:hypothetical protein